MSIRKDNLTNFLRLLKGQINSMDEGIKRTLDGLNDIVPLTKEHKETLFVRQFDNYTKAVLFININNELHSLIEEMLDVEIPHEFWLSYIDLDTECIYSNPNEVLFTKSLNNIHNIINKIDEDLLHEKMYISEQANSKWYYGIFHPFYKDKLNGINERRNELNHYMEVINETLFLFKDTIRNRVVKNFKDEFEYVFGIKLTPTKGEDVNYGKTEENQ